MILLLGPIRRCFPKLSPVLVGLMSSYANQEEARQRGEFPLCGLCGRTWP